MISRTLITEYSLLVLNLLIQGLHDEGLLIRRGGVCHYPLYIKGDVLNDHFEGPA